MTTPVTRKRRDQFQQSRRQLCRLAVLLLLTLVTGVGFAGPAAAHNVLTSSDPADGATLQAPPTVLRLTFDQPVQDFEPVVTVIGPDGQRHESGVPHVDSTVVTADVGALPVAGSYTIAYRVVSADGHPVQGELRFELAQAAPTSSAQDVPTPVSPAPATSSAVSETSGAESSVDAAPTTTGTSSAEAEPTSSSSGPSGWVWAAIAVVAGLVATAIVVIIRRPRQPE